MAIITSEADKSNKLEIEKCIQNLLDRNITFILRLQEKLDFHVASNLLSKNKNIVLVSPNDIKKLLFKFNLNENQVNENNYLLLSEKYECNKIVFWRRSILMIKINCIISKRILLQFFSWFIEHS